MGTLINALPENSPSQNTSKQAGRRLMVMRIVFGVVFISLLAMLVATMPMTYRQVLSLDYPEVGRPPGWSEAETRAALAGLGWTDQTLANLNLARSLVNIILFLGTAALIFWQKKDDWMGVYVPWVLVAIAFTITISNTVIDALFTDQRIKIILGNFFFLQAFLLPYFFPDGRFVPHRMRWILIAWAYIMVATAFPGSAFNPEEWPAPYSALFNFSLIGSLLVSIVYRYVRVSNREQRYQTRVAVLGMTLAVAAFMLLWGVINPAIQPALEARSPQGLLIEIILGLVSTLMFGLLPISFTIAILRYHLWDIDVIIRKTLVYTVVTGLLAGVYFGGVILLQGIFSRLGTGQSPAALVLSTLLIAALFNPLRRRVQEGVDRRFYRKKYDAEGVLAAFAAQARDEVDIERLSAALVGAIEETVQPSQVLFWLKPGQGGNTN